jgi:lambda repressor-like predicted transcriptional regulator
VDLEGQLSNPDKPLKTLTPQGSRAKTSARQARLARQKQGGSPRQPASDDELGHYSNPAAGLAGEDQTRPDDDAPLPAAPHPTRGRLRLPDIDALVDRYRAGDTINELADRFGINRTTVIAHLDRRGVQRRALSKQWDHKTLTYAVRSYADGSSLAAIAEQFGLDPSTVANRFRRAGVPIRPRRGWG